MKIKNKTSLFEKARKETYSKRYCRDFEDTTKTEFFVRRYFVKWFYSVFREELQLWDVLKILKLLMKILIIIYSSSH